MPRDRWETPRMRGDPNSMEGCREEAGSRLREGLP